MGFRSGSLAPCRRMLGRRDPCRNHFSSRRSLDLGRRLARAARRQLRNSGWAAAQAALLDRGPGGEVPRHMRSARLGAPRRGLDRRTAPRQNSRKKASRPPCPATALFHVPLWLRLLATGWAGWPGNLPPFRNHLAACPALRNALPAHRDINTLLAASAAALATTFSVTRFRFRRKPDASLCANGWLAGLVASCCLQRRHRRVPPRPPSSLARRRRHLHAAAWSGSCSSSLFPSTIHPALSQCTGRQVFGDCSGVAVRHLRLEVTGQLLCWQLIGIAALLSLALPAGLFSASSSCSISFVPFRVDPDGERIGMDLHELGGGAYPEFVIHRDESYR